MSETFPAPLPPDIRGTFRARARQVTSVPSMFRISVACVVSYWVAAWVADRLGTDIVPFFAPITTLMATQVSVLGTFGLSVQRTVGTVAGVILASVASALLGFGMAVLFAVVLASLVLARLLPFGVAARNQVGVSALMAMGLGVSEPHYGLWRVVDTVIGGVIGLVLLAAYPPKPPLREALAAQRALAKGVSSQLRELAGFLADLSSRPDKPLETYARHPFLAGSRNLRTLGAAATDATDAAVEAGGYNFRARRLQRELAALQARQRMLSRSALEVRVISISVDQLYDRMRPDPLVDRSGLAEVFKLLGDAFDRRMQGRDTTTEVLELRVRIERLAEGVAAHASRSVSVALGSVGLLGRVEQVRAEVEQHAVPFPPTASGRRGVSGAAEGEAGRPG